MAAPVATWNLTIDDPSPILSYNPYSDGLGLTNGWEVYVPGIGFNNQSGEGTYDYNSLHLTSLQNASVTVEVYASALYLYGYANCTYNVTLDNVAQDTNSPTGDVLYSVENMTPGTHYVTLTAQPTDASQQLGFDYAIAGIPMGSDGSAPTPMVYNNQNSSLVYQGNWQTDHDPQIPSTTDPGPYRQSSDKGDTVSLTFSGASAVAINGTTNYGHWTYQVTLDGTQTINNGSGWWLFPNQMLFFQDNLDPRETHTINMTNLNQGYQLAVNSFTVWSTNSTSNSTSPTSTHKSNHAGVIAGSVIGGIAGLLLILFALWWFFFKSRGPTKVKSVRAHEGVLEAGDPMPVPFEPLMGTVPHTSTVGTSSFSGPEMTTPSIKGAPILMTYNPAASSSGTHISTLSPQHTGTPRPATSGLPSDLGSIGRPSGSDGRPPLSPVRSANFSQQQQQQEPAPAPHGTDLNRIIEMIAERIDPRSARHDPSGPPPEYRG